MNILMHLNASNLLMKAMPDNYRRYSLPTTKCGEAGTYEYRNYLLRKAKLYKTCYILLVVVCSIISVIGYGVGFLTQ